MQSFGGKITKRERDRRKKRERKGKREREREEETIFTVLWEIHGGGGHKELFVFLCMILGVGLILTLHQ